MDTIRKTRKISKIVDIIASTDAKLYDTYTVTCEYLTSNKDVKIFYPSNKYSIVIKDPDNNVKPTLDAYELAVTHSMVQSTNYSHNKYKNLSWAMQHL
jgi:hypothetical protein